MWDEEFVVELEGSQNLRVLLYEETGPRAVLRGRATQMVLVNKSLKNILILNFLTAE